MYEEELDEIISEIFNLYKIEIIDYDIYDVFSVICICD